MANEEKGFQKNNIHWYPGHMAKTKREIKEKLDLIDIVYEVIDARMPKSSKIVDIDDLIKNKPRLLIMTKYDLCDKKETDKFISYYENLGYQVIPVDLMSGTNVKKIIEASEVVLESENEKRKAKGLKPRNIRALILGVPNAGKSTLINRLVGKKSAGVGNKPGFTKSLSWIRIHKNIDLLDTPGILWPKFEDPNVGTKLGITGAIKDTLLYMDDLALFLLAYYQENHVDLLVNRYNVTQDDVLNNTPVDLLIKITEKMNLRDDYEAASQRIIFDYRKNNLGSVTLDKVEQVTHE